MKTTVEIPDLLFRRVKAAAAAEGIPLKDFFTEAVREQLRRRGSSAPARQPWRKAFGGLRHLRTENRRLERVIAAEFGRIDEEDWR